VFVGLIMLEKGYLILLDVDARKRHYHIAEAGRVIKFVVREETSHDRTKEIFRKEQYACKRIR